jgi:tRNA pseudouridine65 synthase
VTELEILHHDDRFVVINKPSGMIVHQGWARDPKETVALQRVRDQIGRHVYPVHRLDRGASGCLVFALTPEAAAWFQEELNAGRVKKTYLALVRGIIEPPEGIIDHPVRQGEESSSPRVPAVTEYRRVAIGERCSLVECVPRTGRLHQIRRHLKHVSHPIIGDVNYGDGRVNREFRERFGLRRLALHALEITFGAKVRAGAPLPADLELAQIIST